MSMPGDLVKQAIEQSRSREPIVTAMALLHGARVLAAVDREAAKAAFAEGRAMAEELPPDGRYRDFVHWEAARLGAGADPAAAVALFCRLQQPFFDIHRRTVGCQLVQSLAESGEFEIAVELLEDLSCPAGGAAAVVSRTPSVELKRRAMAAARARWRLHDDPFRHGEDLEFFHLFTYHWQGLEPADQLNWLDEILQAIDAAPESSMGGAVGEVGLRSTKDMQLFGMLHALRALKLPEEVDAILRAHPDLAKAAEVYPLGWESHRVAAAKPAGGVTGLVGGGFGGGSSVRDRSLMEAVRKGHEGDPTGVTDMLDEAHSRFLVDKAPESPNNAPLPFWPSCRAYQTAMYWAGKMLGMAGTALLAEIPETDLALFGSIELAAGVLGLPEYSGVQVGQRSRRER